MGGYLELRDRIEALTSDGSGLTGSVATDHSRSLVAESTRAVAFSPPLYGITRIIASHLLP